MQLHLIQVSCREATLKGKIGQESLQSFKTISSICKSNQFLRSGKWVNASGAWLGWAGNSWILTEWKRKQASLGGQLSTGSRGSTQSGCPEKVQNLWEFSGREWAKPWTTWSELSVDPSSSRRVEYKDSQGPRSQNESIKLHLNVIFNVNYFRRNALKPMCTPPLLLTQLLADPI